MFTRGLLILAVFLSLTGCGAAANPAAMTEEDITGAPGSPGPDKTDTAKPDKKAEEAKGYCAHEVKKSQSNPPESLNKKQISACLIALRPEVNTKCAKGVEREIVLKIIVGSDGNVISAFPVGDGADSDEAACVADIVRPAAFPHFTGKEQQVIEKYPFKIQP